MMRDDYEAAAREVATAARRKIRDEFQMRHPKYTPPPDDEPRRDLWERWLKANVELHGWPGVVERGLHSAAPKSLGTLGTGED